VFVVNLAPMEDSRCGWHILAAESRPVRCFLNRVINISIPPSPTHHLVFTDVYIGISYKGRGCLKRVLKEIC
jgi:hypothetical protein